MRSGLALLLLASFPALSQPPAEALSLRVVTLNTWHGFRPAKLGIRWIEEPSERRERFECQIGQLQALEPDLILLQEVNPIPQRSRYYAEQLGYEEVHRVASCGLRLGPIGIPRGIAEGLTILAKPGLALRKVQSPRLSGPGGCWCPNLGFQLAETRYALFGEITVAGQRLLVGNTHLHAQAQVGRDFGPEIDRLLESGVITRDQEQAIRQRRSRAEARRLMETGRLLTAVERLASKSRDSAGPFAGVILGGDFNAQPTSPVVDHLLAAGFKSLTAGADRPTLDRRRNENRDDASSARNSMPDFDVPELEKLYDLWNSEPSQADYLFLRLSEHTGSSRAELAFQQPCSDDRLPSDHFGLVVDLALPAEGPPAY